MWWCGGDQIEVVKSPWWMFGEYQVNVVMVGLVGMLVDRGDMY